MTHASGDVQEKSCPGPGPASEISTEAVLKARIRRSLQRLDRPLADAVSLEPEMYRDAAVFELERKDVFRRNWVSVCRLEDLSGVTNCKAVEIAGERLFVIRKRSGEVRALSRTCAHRWAELASPEGQVQRLVCPNHAWVYDLDGQLIGAPQMDAAEVRARFGCRLDSFACETWQGWVFVNLDGNARPLGEGLAAIDAQVAPWQLDRMRRIMLSGSTRRQSGHRSTTLKVSGHRTLTSIAGLSFQPSRRTGLACSVAIRSRYRMDSAAPGPIICFPATSSD